MLTSYNKYRLYKDITCVSLLSLGVKGTRFQLCKTSQSKKTVQVYQQNQVGGYKKINYFLFPQKIITLHFNNTNASCTLSAT